VLSSKGIRIHELSGGHLQDVEDTGGDEMVACLSDLEPISLTE